MGTTLLASYCTKINASDVKCGDLFIRTAPQKGHVVAVVDRDKNKVTTIEASGSKGENKVMFKEDRDITIDFLGNDYFPYRIKVDN